MHSITNLLLHSSRYAWEFTKMYKTQGGLTQRSKQFNKGNKLISHIENYNTIASEQKKTPNFG